MTKFIIELLGESNGKKQSWPIEEYACIGSDSGCGIHISESDVELRHTRLEIKEKTLLLKDLRSAQGSFVNGSRVIEAILADGDVVRVGNCEFVVHDNSILKTEFPLTSKSEFWGEQLQSLSSVAETQFPILLLGPSGSGKDVIAQAIHGVSECRSWPFLSVNCSALTETLIESELFGHVRGAFTGAVADRRGKFELADGGTIFLDEIADMSLKTQAKVLRVLQEQTMEQVGGTARIKVDARVLAATNKDLQNEIRSGNFREDLYFRLSVIPVFVPPLRERQEDIPLLADHFMSEFAREYGRRAKRFDQGALSLLQHYTWPGNVRELRNVIERLVIMVPRESITEDDLGFLVQGATTLSEAHAPVVTRLTLQEARERFERDLILRTLAEQQGNMSRTADVLGVERSNLYRKMRGFGIAPSRRLDADDTADAE